MKKGFTLILLSIVLTACSGVLTFELDIDRFLPPDLTVSNLNLTSDFTATIDGVTQPVICQDRTTRLNYSFNFNGTLNGWSSYLKGENTGAIAPDSRATFDSTSSAINYQTRTVAVEYTIPAGLAPLSDTLETEAIVVKPIVEGKTQLFVEVAGYDEVYGFSFKSIPVLSFCN